LEDYSNIEDIDPITPQPEIVNTAVELIKKEGVIVFPTWCFYGLGCNALSEKAIGKVFDIKRRPSNKPLLVLISDSYNIKNIVKTVPEYAKIIIGKFWPGRITLVFEAKDNIPKVLTSGTGKIGVRIPENKVAKAIVDKLQIPLTGTSANISDQPGCSDIKKMNPSIVKESDLVLNSGSLKGGKGSTIVDVTVDPPKILREGEISSKDIFEAIGL
jgi:L-threonylcarbamoyladenylate synthase